MNRRPRPLAASCALFASSLAFLLCAQPAHAARIFIDPGHGSIIMPGGGVDPGESPSDAVLREVFEESGQQIVLNRVLSLESEHWIGRSLVGRLEDFHALRIIYAATCEAPSDPVVHDVGGSTFRADWVPTRTWRTLNWTNGSRALLSQYARKLSRG